MMMDMPQGLAFLAALKTLTRFKQFEHKQFAEYYLIGTLSSAIIGILLGIVASKIW
jgi:vacuolar-type H+-ATPase subunit I/STV1